VHCSSKLRLEAAALAFVLAFFPPMTQLFIKLPIQKYIFNLEMYGTFHSKKA